MLFYVCCVIYFYLYTNTTDETGQTITTDSLPSHPWYSTHCLSVVWRWSG